MAPVTSALHKANWSWLRCRSGTDRTQGTCPQGSARNRLLLMQRRHIYHRSPSHRKTIVWIWIHTIWHWTNVYCMPEPTLGASFNDYVQSYNLDGVDRSCYHHFTGRNTELGKFKWLLHHYAAIKWKRWDSQANSFDASEWVFKMLCSTDLWK